MQDVIRGQNIFVGNLASSVTEQTLRNLFTPFGEVLSTIVVRDRDTGAPRGFAFVEMKTEIEAILAIASVQGKMLDHRLMSVNQARSKENTGSSIHEHMRRHREHRY